MAKLIILFIKKFIFVEKNYAVGNRWTSFYTWLRF